jgi:hypothetical protein
METVTHMVMGLIEAIVIVSVICAGMFWLGIATGAV